MNKALRMTLIVIGFLVIAGGLVFAGALIGRHTASNLGWLLTAYRSMDSDNSPYGRFAPGMMDNRRGSGFGMPHAPMLRSGPSAGMGGGRGSGPSAGLGGYGYNNAPVTPLTVDQAYQAAGEYLAALNNPDLKIVEVMVFDNNAYVRVVEQSTGIGAFELLVDPATLSVTLEHGPNMMWNLKYAGLNHQNMMGGRSGMSLAPALRTCASAGVGYPTFSTTPAVASAEMPVTPAQALLAAQQYLDSALPGTTTAADADPFYGYYTIDIQRDGKIVGMLSVNGITSQLFMHTWHGTFIATQDY